MCSKKSVTSQTQNQEESDTEAKHTSSLFLLNGDSVLYGELDELSTRS